MFRDRINKIIDYYDSRSFQVDTLSPCSHDHGTNMWSNAISLSSCFLQHHNHPSFKDANHTIRCHSIATVKLCQRQIESFSELSLLRDYAVEVLTRSCRLDISRSNTSSIDLNCVEIMAELDSVLSIMSTVTLSLIPCLQELIQVRCFGSE